MQKCITRKESIMGGFSDFAKYDGLGLGELVSRKDVRPSELVEEAIDRIDRLNPQLNAVIHKIYDQARIAAEGDLPRWPLHRCSIPAEGFDSYVRWCAHAQR
jgi:amidase